MKKSEYEKAAEKYLKALKDGLGTGRGADYKPALNVRSFSSEGKVSQYFGVKSGRAHQLLSGKELDYAILLDWSDSVIEFREQYPLDLPKTILIANRLGIKHPVERFSRFPSVRTTDFLIDMQTPNGIRTVARTVKPASKLGSKRVIELFEIERVYWEEEGVDWGIVTDKELPSDLCINLKDILQCHHLDEHFFEPHMNINHIILCLAQSLQISNHTIRHTLIEFEKEQHLSPGVALTLFKHLIARKGIRVNLSCSLRDVLNLASKCVIIGDLSLWR